MYLLRAASHISLEENRKWAPVSEARGGDWVSGDGVLGRTCPSQGCTLFYAFRILNLIFLMRKGYFTWLPWSHCLGVWSVSGLCLSILGQGHSPSSCRSADRPGVCALRLFLQSSRCSGLLYLCMESRIRLLLQQKGWLQCRLACCHSLLTVWF